jgi:hypothetical protein
MLSAFMRLIVLTQVVKKKEDFLIFGLFHASLLQRNCALEYSSQEVGKDN